MISVARQFLLSLILDHVRPHWPERRFLRHFLRRLSVDAVFDVGANVGQFAQELRLLGYKGLIVSFEPDPDCFKKLCEQARKDPKWQVFNVALGRTAGEGQLNVMARSDFNSFRKPAAISTPSLKRMNEVIGTVRVPIRTLSDCYIDLRAEHGFQRPYLKLDTQGYDLEVFAGGEAVCSEFVGMQSELSLKPIYEGMPPWREAAETYEAAGFEICGMFPVDPWGTELVEMNCYLSGPRVRSDL